jgi:hypothetical protein
LYKHVYFYQYFAIITRNNKCVLADGRHGNLLILLTVLFSTIKMIRGDSINMAIKPEDKARVDIDGMLERAGWDV